MEVLKIEKYTFTGISKTGGKQCHSIVQKIIRSSVIFSNYASLVECFHGFDKEITAVFLYPGINTSIFLSSKNVFSQSLGWKFFFFFKIQYIGKHGCNPARHLHLQPVIKMFNTQYNCFEF